MSRPARTLLAAVLATALTAALTVALGTALPGPVSAGRPPEAQTPPDQTLFFNAVFASTNHSYSGNLGGQRGSLQDQLAQGVRAFEFDIWADNLGKYHDFEIGDGSPGRQVDKTGGNPQSNLLRPWLDQISSWSTKFRGHAPITVMLNVQKRDWSGSTVYRALNTEIESAFGARLLRADQPGATNGTIGAMRGRIIVGLTGSSSTRVGYVRSLGLDPAVALNKKGQVVAVFTRRVSGGGFELWYWSGLRRPDGRIAWQMTGKYDDGLVPSVALDDNGVLVEVHKSVHLDLLYSRVAIMADDGTLKWGSSQYIGGGLRPSIISTGAGQVREVHETQSPFSVQRYQWLGTANAAKKSMNWHDNAKTSDPFYPRATATAGSRSITVRLDTNGPANEAALEYVTTNPAVLGRITWQRPAFVPTDDHAGYYLRSQNWFAQATAAQKSYVVKTRNQSNTVVWVQDFNKAADTTTPLANMPATAYPNSDWYKALMTKNHAVR